MNIQGKISIVFCLILSTTNTDGQLTCPAPRSVDVTCLPNDAIHPVPGTVYTYSVNVPSPPGTKEYTWFVTQDKNFIVSPGNLTSNRETAGGNFLAATGTGYNDPASGASTLSLTWKSFVYDSSNPVFVVIQVRNSAGSGLCSTQNLKVFRIQPMNAFTIDIANLAADKTTVSPYETSIDRCISDIVSASFDSNSPEGVLYDFGIDYLYYAVTAANFSTSWKPSLQVQSIDPNETITAVEWFRPSDTGFSNAEAMTLASGTTYTAINPVTALASSGAVGSAGECIIIRMTIDHTNGSRQYTGLTDETISVAVDGKTQLSLATPIGDVHFSKSLPVVNSDCGLEDGFKYDVATQILKARPDIQSATATSPGPGDVQFLPVK